MASAAQSLRDIDKKKGERTVGVRRNDAWKCLTDAGFTLESSAGEEIHPKVAELLALVPASR
jgi:hypothetical protein